MRPPSVGPDRLLPGRRIPVHRLERLGLARNVHVDTSAGPDEQVEAFLAGRPTFLCGFPNAIAAAGSKACLASVLLSSEGRAR